MRLVTLFWDASDEVSTRAVMAGMAVVMHDHARWGTPALLDITFAYDDITYRGFVLQWVSMPWPLLRVVADQVERCEPSRVVRAGKPYPDYPKKYVREVHTPYTEVTISETTYVIVAK